MASPTLTLTDLPWLPRATPEFRTQLTAIEKSDAADCGAALRALATHNMGINQALAMSQAVARLQSQKRLGSLSRFKLGLVSNSTTDFLRPLLVASAVRHGIALEVVAADFGQIVQEALNPQSTINLAKPDAVLLALDYRGLPLRVAGGADWPLYDEQAALAELATVRQGFKSNCGAVCIVQTLAAPAELLFGSLDIGVSGTLRAAIAGFNAKIARDVVATGDILIDIEWLAQCIGLHEWFDDRQWHSARLACSQKSVPVYAEFVARALGAIRGKSRKCLVLDLDNTLWGGVIGDDGIEGIYLNPGDARGEAFRAIQSLAADLRRRGVVLAVCSKNDDLIARGPFRSHPGMILKEADIAVFMANWEDKATNLERIARQLDLGIDALVLLDDNPAERAQVRQALPQVAVPEVGDDATNYARILTMAGYFESVAFTREDLARADQYKSNADRARLLETARNLDEFLQSLEMQIEFAPFSAAGRKRTTQLINKTNQFNTTTRRYTEQQVASLEGSREHYTLQVAVRDKFGDNGMIGVVICTIVDTRWEIDTWLMSCRVLNRQVEHAVCNRLVRAALAAGARQLVGTYIPTDRNGLVKDLFSRLGFQRLPDDTETQQRWILDLDGYVPLPAFFTERTQEEFPSAASA